MAHGLESSGLGQEPVKSSCERGDELSGSIKGGKFLDYLSNLRKAVFSGAIYLCQLGLYCVEWVDAW
jgi:hypothetical protein